MIVKPPRDEISSRYDFVQRIINACSSQIPGLPEGRVKISHRENNDYYYRVTKESKGDLVDKPTAEKIAQRSYYEKVLKLAQTEERLLKQLIDKYPDTTADELYESMSDERKDLVAPIILTDKQYVDKWLAQEYRHKGFREGMPFYTTVRGERVRSKSEQIIADRLAANNIPYLYERPVQIGNEIIHPDFTILRISDRKELYLEHLGKLGDMGYATDAVDRLNRYHRNGIIQGDKLFLLWETGDLPFDVRTLDVLIEQKFM